MTPLELGQPLVRELGAGKSHVYRIEVTEGQYFQISIAQLGVDVAAALRTPGGMTVFESDHPGGPIGEERISWVTDASGTYLVEVRSTQASSRAGPYTIRLQDFRPALPQDESRIAARRLFAEAERLAASGSSAESRTRALEKYQGALSLWQKVADREEEAACLLGLGILRETSDPRQAAMDYDQALSLSHAMADRRGEADALTNMAALSDRHGDNPRTIEYCERAIPLWRETGYLDGEAQALNILGAVHAASGDRHKAIESLDEALRLAEDVGDRQTQAGVLIGLKMAYEWLGELQKALDYSNRALALTRVVEDHAQQAAALTSLSLLYNELGDYDNALQLLEEALRLRYETGDLRGESYTLTTMGHTYQLMGRHEEALAYYNRALRLRRAVKDLRGEATTLDLIGQVCESMGERRAALGYLEDALKLNKSSGDRGREAGVLRDMGVIYGSLGETDRGVDLLRAVLSSHRSTGNLRSEPVTLYELARLEANRGNLSEARTLLAEALTTFESLRTRLGSSEVRASYLATVEKAFALAVDVWMRSHEESPDQGFDAAGFALAERSRARSLLDLLTEAHAKVRSEADPSLLERERSLQEQLTAESEKRMRLLLSPRASEETDETNRRIETLESSIQQVEAHLRATAPRYAALTQPRPLTLTEIQRELDPETLLLEYALGEKRSFLWAVTPTSITSHPLPNRHEIEAAARRVYQLLTERDRRPRFETVSQRIGRIRRADAEYPKAAAVLSEMLLSPVRSQLRSKRLLVIPDGALQYLPFAALPDPATTVKSSDWTPLIADHEIVGLPSASILPVLREELARRAQRPKTVVVVADPVFDRMDKRVRAPVVAGRSERGSPTAFSSKTSGDQERDLFRSAVDAGVTSGGSLSLPRLRFTRREAQAILRWVPPQSRKEALDFDANRETATAPELAQYRFVHFATHGFIDSVHPELSGIVLSLVDRSGRPLPGFLPAAEVFNLKLPADLVVLSGCRTALGKEIRGEGLVGLTRAFFYAGAARVAASLWKVEDRSTAELMARFYGGMLGKEKLRPAAALRVAQLSMWRQNQWKSPYYWSGFVLQGEWREEPVAHSTGETEHNIDIVILDVRLRGRGH